MNVLDMMVGIHVGNEHTHYTVYCLLWSRRNIICYVWTWQYCFLSESDSDHIAEE